MADSRHSALLRLEAVLERAAADGALDSEACAELPVLVEQVPGRLREVTRALSATRSAASLDALLELPRGAPGVIEGVFAALAEGASRREVGLAMDFRHSRARSFPLVLETATRWFPDSLERLQVGRRLHYRFTVSRRRGRSERARVDTALRWLEPRLSRLRGTRLWISGWCFAGDPIPATAHRHLVQAWLQGCSRAGEPSD